MIPRPPDGDEHLHTPLPDPGWTEAYGFEFVAVDATLAGFVVMTMHPKSARSWCWSAVTGRDLAVCVVDEPEAPLPRRAGLELRAPALWVDVEIEVPYVHATVGMEAFGLLFDDADEALRSGHGDRTPFGLDLEWESDDAEVVVGARTDSWHYALDSRVSGEVLLGQERYEIDGPGRRWHRWGTHPWWSESPPVGRTEIRHAVTRVPFAETSTGPAVEVVATLDTSGWSITRRSSPGAAGMAR